MSVYIVLMLALLASAWLAARSHNNSWERHVSHTAYLVALFFLPLGIIMLLGSHKPLHMTFGLPDTVMVLAFKPIENEGIYIYVDQKDEEPLPIRMPWDAKKAEKMQQEAEKSARKGMKGKFKMKLTRGEDRSLRFDLDLEPDNLEARTVAKPHPPTMVPMILDRLERMMPR